MEFMVRCSSCMPSGFRMSSGFRFKLRFAVVVFEIVLILAWLEVNDAKLQEQQFQWGGLEGRVENIAPHSCIHDRILEQRKRPGRKMYSVTPQVYEPGRSEPLQHRGRALLGVSTSSEPQKDEKQPIMMLLATPLIGIVKELVTLLRTK